MPGQRREVFMHPRPVLLWFWITLYLEKGNIPPKITAV
ncbi:unnamed protein product [Arabidopsis halleri]